MTVYDFTVKGMNGQDISLGEFRGKVLLIVNTATKCGLTPQYAELQKLHDEYSGSGLEILDFPCNQFANQAPGTESEINDFCVLNYKTAFARFAKIDVNGQSESPLYGFLKSQRKGMLGSKNVKWNFTKFLVDKTGNVVARYGPATAPKAIETKVRELLG